MTERINTTKEEIKNETENRLKQMIYLYHHYIEKEDQYFERRMLDGIFAFVQALSIVEPLTRIGNFTEILAEFCPSDDYVNELFVNYEKFKMTPKEKYFLAKIQNCITRHQIVDVKNGHALAREQRDRARKSTGVSLFLM